jgi:polysaccharide biosynthesis/export protein
MLRRDAKVALLVLIIVGGIWNPAAAQLAPYIIGPDDVLPIELWDWRTIDDVLVRPDGKIRLPVLRDVDAAGLTASELAARLTERYKGLLHRSLAVTVAVRNVRSRPVFFLGAVRKPGTLWILDAMPLRDALSAVGGPAAGAELESAFVLRDTTRIPVDLRKLYEGDVAQNITLRPKDTVVVPGQNFVCVPAIDCVSVTGAVTTPGPVKYTNDLTVGSAIEAAGGLTPFASGRIVVSRGETATIPWPSRRRPRIGRSIMPDPTTLPVRTDASEYTVDHALVSIDVPLIDSISVGDAYRLSPGDVVRVLQKLF